MAAKVVIDARFRGPPDSANGGYACAMVAAHLEPEPAIEVTLRAPPPLDRPLTVEAADGAARMLDGDVVVAEGSAADLPGLEIPAPVSLDDARRAREDSPMQSEHPYPMCFVCGTDRAHDGGLCVTCGPVAGRVVAAPFETDETMAADDGSVRPELVWSVLDCPGGIAGMLVPDLGLSVLGRLAGRLDRPLEAGANYIAIGWPMERDGRKWRAGSAILDEVGEPHAVSVGTWIELRDQPAS